MTSRRISLRKPAPEAAPPAVATAEPVSPRKGRATPKRSDARRRRGPVAPPPSTRREAARRLREQQAEARRSVRAGTVAHDQQRMLPRDAGPVRARVRDLVDGRVNLGVVLLPAAISLVVLQIVAAPEVVALAGRVWTLTLLLVIADLVATTRLLRRVVRAEFPEERRTRGHVGYGLLRTTVIRRFRMPPPRVVPTTVFRRLRRSRD